MNALPQQTALETPYAKSLDRGIRHLLALQKEKGYWEGDVFDNVTITAQYVLFRRFIRKVDKRKEKGAIKYILQSQLQDGSWNLFYGGPGDLNSTVEAYQALKIAGFDKDHPSLKKAREFILGNGGLGNIRIFTRISLALFDQYPWDEIPQMPPELMFMPKELPFNILDLSSWSRSVIIPLLIIFYHQPVYKISADRGIQELYEESKEPINFDYHIRKNTFLNTERIFVLVDKFLGFYNLSPITPFRKKAIKKAEAWILEHQDRSGYWGGIFPAMTNSVLALLLQGYSMSHPAVYHGLKAIDRFASRKNGMYRVQSTVSPVWDTAITLYTLLEAGLDRKSPELRKAGRWLLRQQVKRKGDWAAKCPRVEPGGWPFEFENDFFPDNDDTALALLALKRLNLGHEEPRKKKACKRGLDWILGMQCQDGGWGAFDKDNNLMLLNDIPFADLKSLLDPSSPDVTGHVLEILGKQNFKMKHPVVQRAVDYLKQSQEVDGSWFGRWGVNYTYGTSAVLIGLETVGENMNTPYVRRALEWLASVQNEDGGWGESCKSYETREFVRSESTPSQTAWSALGLLTPHRINQTSVQRALDWLIRHQQTDGSWDEPHWTATGFPGHFYLRYEMYRLYFPVLALARGLNRL